MYFILKLLFDKSLLFGYYRRKNVKLENGCVCSERCCFKYYVSRTQLSLKKVKFRIEKSNWCQRKLSIDANSYRIGCKPYN